MPWVPSKDEIRREREYRDKAQRERLRDQFAMAALTGILAHPDDVVRNDDQWAEVAYDLADAMLRQRLR